MGRALQPQIVDKEIKVKILGVTQRDRLSCVRW
jgi:hypothetical protein